MRLKRWASAGCKIVEGEPELEIHISKNTAVTFSDKISLTGHTIQTSHCNKDINKPWDEPNGSTKSLWTC